MFSITRSALDFPSARTAPTRMQMKATNNRGNVSITQILILSRPNLNHCDTAQVADFTCGWVLRRDSVSWD
jgi:hypothetical protein